MLIVASRLAHRSFGQHERGGFLLEALISVLIVAFGVLGLIGLQARAFQHVDDAQYRAEAVFLAHALIGRMWVTDRQTLSAGFDSSAGGTAYSEFRTRVGQRLPGAALPGNEPVVTVVQPGASGTPTSSDVLIRIHWLPPGEAVRHSHEIVATIGSNE